MKFITSLKLEKETYELDYQISVELDYYSYLRASLSNSLKKKKLNKKQCKL